MPSPWDSRDGVKTGGCIGLIQRFKSVRHQDTLITDRDCGADVDNVRLQAKGKKDCGVRLGAASRNESSRSLSS